MTVRRFGWMKRPLIAMLIAASTPAQVLAQPNSAADSTKSIGEIPVPALPGAISLRPAQRKALPEQWENLGALGRIVRNVVDPMLIPVLPDPGKANGVAVVLAPGGSFEQLYIDKEGFAVARSLADRGITAFVLKYRTEPVGRTATERAANRTSPIDSPAHPEAKPNAVEDGLAAVRLLRQRAAEWRIDPAKIGFVGFSAGAMTTLAVGLTPDKTARPDFIAPIYGPMWERRVPSDAPPIFIALALDDPIFGVGEKLPLIQNWRDAGRPISVHLYDRGGHGFSHGLQGAMWIEEMLAWMHDRGLFAKEAPVTSYSVNSLLGELLDDPAARGIVLRHLPGLLSFPQLDKARAVTLKLLGSYVPAQFPKAAVDQIDAELALLRR